MRSSLVVFWTERAVRRAGVPMPICQHGFWQPDLPMVRDDSGMDVEEHARQLDALISRIDAAADRIFGQAERLSGEVGEREDREVGKYGDAMQVGIGTQRRWRRLEQLDAYADATTESVVAWAKEASRIYARRPTSAWGRRSQRRQLLSIAKYFERAAGRLGETHP